MTFFIVAAVVVVVLGALAWWTSGRARPDLRRQSIDSSLQTSRGEVGQYDPPTGPAGIGGGGY